MVRIAVPGLCGFSLRVKATTNSTTWHAGLVNLETQAVETLGGEVIPRSAVRRLRYEGVGTWIPPHQAREVVLLLAMIGGATSHQLHELAVPRRASVWKRAGVKQERRSAARVVRRATREGARHGAPRRGYGTQLLVPSGRHVEFY